MTIRAEWARRWGPPGFSCHQLSSGPPRTLLLRVVRGKGTKGVTLNAIQRKFPASLYPQPTPLPNDKIIIKSKTLKPS